MRRSYWQIREERICKPIFIVPSCGMCIRENGGLPCEGKSTCIYKEAGGS